MAGAVERWGSCRGARDQRERGVDKRKESFWVLGDMKTVRWALIQALLLRTPRKATTASFFWLLIKNRERSLGFQHK